MEVITLPELEDLDPDVVHLCDQFKRYHKQRCQGLIGSDKRFAHCFESATGQGILLKFLCLNLASVFLVVKYKLDAFTVLNCACVLY